MTHRLSDIFKSSPVYDKALFKSDLIQTKWIQITIAIVFESWATVFNTKCIKIMRWTLNVGNVKEFRKMINIAVVRLDLPEADQRGAWDASENLCHCSLRFTVTSKDSHCNHCDGKFRKYANSFYKFNCSVCDFEYTETFIEVKKNSAVQMFCVIILWFSHNELHVAE